MAYRSTCKFLIHKASRRKHRRNSCDLALGKDFLDTTLKALDKIAILVKQFKTERIWTGKQSRKYSLNYLGGIAICEHPKAHMPS